ncbi:MAG TPA: hypothetical protein VKT72_05970 [Candidatus Baltobacteraceae bacterium]|nr:hypothetical protein [Candidatus Baltobacteraceae bacterium]
MLSRFFAFCVLAAVLSACGGGGTSPSAPPNPLPSASTAPAPAPNPAASGDSFWYSGSLTEAFTVYGTPGPLPSPSASPQPTATPWISTTRQNVSQNVKISTGTTFAGQSGLMDLTTDETDAGAHATTAVTSDTYVNYAPDSTRAGGIDVTTVGTTSKDSNGVSNEVTNGTGSGVSNELPEVPNARWTNTAARAQTEDDPGEETIVSAYAADGSYQENIAYPEGGTAAVQMNSDGSGVYQLPVVGTTSQNSSITVEAPSGSQIQLAYAIYGAGLPQVGGFTLPVWYPQVPPVLASDTYVDEGAATIPASCNVASNYSSSSGLNKIVETKTRLDTVFGELETDTATAYVSSSFGVVCAIVNGDLKTYYDFSGQSAALFYFAPDPMEETAVSETLGLQSAQLATSSARRPSMSNAPAIAAIAAPSLAHVRAIFALAQARHARAVYARMHSRTSR